jgi:tetratricopeptide (TPR) repeat protein
MKCNNCGFDNPDSNKFCGECGERIIAGPLEIVEEKKPENPSEISGDIENDADINTQPSNVNDVEKTEIKNESIDKKRKSTIPIILIGILVVVALGCFLGRNQIAYSLAKYYMGSGQFDKATSEFQKLGEYKDSSDLLHESIYQSAVQLLTNKKFDEAVSQFQKLGTYKDASNLLLASKYQLAVQYLSNQKYDKAKSLLIELGEYKDSHIFITEANYQIAKDLYSHNNLSGAKEILLSLKGYKDSNDILYEIYYWYAQSAINSGNTSEAQKYIDMIPSNIYDSLRIKNQIIPKPAPPVPPILRLDPQIGMTADEVRNSSWGSPLKINRTTTAYGVSEQWVYSDYRYIYLDDGIVTAIQDSN